MSLISEVLRRIRRSCESNPFRQRPGAPVPPAASGGWPRLFRRTMVVVCAVTLLTGLGLFLLFRHPEEPPPPGTHIDEKPWDAAPAPAPGPRGTPIQVNTNIIRVGTAVVANPPVDTDGSPSSTNPIEVLSATNEPGGQGNAPTTNDTTESATSGKSGGAEP